MPNQLPPNRAAYLFLPQTDGEYRFFLDAPTHPFESQATGYRKSNAGWLADAALLAYWDKPAPPTLPAGWQQDCIDSGATQCQITKFNDFAILAFRGTQPNQFKDVLFDVNVPMVAWRGGSQVHQGFRDALDEVWGELKKSLDGANVPANRVWFTGHSLGAALAVLAADRLGAAGGVYTFGCPRVGDATFAQLFNQRFPTNSFRFVNGSDIVARVPLPFPGWVPTLPFVHGFEHVAAGQQIDRTGRITASEKASDVLELTAAFGTQWIENVAALKAGRTGNFQQLPPYLADHMPRAYAVRVWNDVLS